MIEESSLDVPGLLVVALLADLGWRVVLTDYCESDQMIPCPTRGTLDTAIDWPRSTVYLSRLACPTPRARAAALARALVRVLDPVPAWESPRAESTPEPPAPAPEDRMGAAIDAAMEAIPCSCDPADTSGGTVHQPWCDTQIPPDVVRKMIAAAFPALAR